MPVTRILVNRFSEMLGKRFSVSELVGRLPYIGLDIEFSSESEIRVEYSPNRPDLGTDVGVARALKGLLEIETGCPKYTVAKSSIVVHTNQDVKTIRPYIVGAIIKGLRFDDEGIRQLISMQEDLHNGVGRQRVRVAIGFHNLAKVKPPIFYSAADAFRAFIPLGYSKEMTISEILRTTDQGRSYGKIVSHFGKFPVLLDSAGNVLSIPPIINSDLTKIDSSVTDLFIDVTGTDPTAATIALNVIATTLYDLGGKVCSIQVKDGKKSVIVPDLEPTMGRVDLKVASELLGIELTPKDARKFLEKARVGVRPRSKSNLEAVIPCYRFDILHPVDLVEEISIGYGVDRLEPLLPPSESIGQLSSRRKFLDCVGEICIGSGLQQTTTYALIPKDLTRLFSKHADSSLSVEETKSLGHEVLRASLFPSLLLVLSLNIHQQYPQRIFEIGDVFEARREEGLVEEKLMLGVAVAHSETDFSEIKSYLQSIFLQLGIETTAVSTVPEDYPAFAGGRSARISMGEDVIGKMGEVAPSILKQMSLRMPTTAFEVDLGPLIRTFQKQQE